MENGLFSMESMGSQNVSFLSNTDSKISSVVLHGKTLVRFIFRLEFSRELFVSFVKTVTLLLLSDF
jgi:hypothetical protein